MADALFELLGEPSGDTTRVLPTGLSRGPWSPDALHGGPVGIIVADAVERHLATSFSGAHLVTRLTLDLERPVPLAPLTVTSELVRPGRKVQVVEVVIADEAGSRLARASALAIRHRNAPLPEDLIAPDDTPPRAPDPGSTGRLGDWGFPASDLAYHQDATEHRFVAGSVSAPGPVTDWIRLAVPVFPDRAPSPLQRVMAAADFLNGVSWTLSGLDWIFINPDLTVTLHRLPVGEHVAVDAVTRIDADGVGTAEADLYDAGGRIGRAVQTLLVEHR